MIRHVLLFRLKSGVTDNQGFCAAICHRQMSATSEMRRVVTPYSLNAGS